MSRKIFPIAVFVALVTLTLSIGACASAGTKPQPLETGELGEFKGLSSGFSSITTEELRDLVFFLADPKRAGRRSGTEGNRTAGAFIAEEFRGYGLSPLDDDFFQDFALADVKNSKYAPANQWLEYLRELGWEVGNNGRNVVGILEGGDKKDEFVVLGAHYDHVGIQKDVLYPGADDNASGTAAILEIAEALGVLAKEGTRPARSVVVALFDAEEWGLFGSQYFVEYPPAPLEQIVAMVNLDMVGRNNPAELQVFGSPNTDDFAERSPELFSATEKAGEVVPFGILFPAEEARREQIFSRSDQASFFSARPPGNRIPVVFYTTGLHEDYHEPSDTAGKIDAEKIRNVSRFAFLVLWQIADADEKPMYQDP